MRSIETFESKETRLKKRRVILSIVLVVIMFGSTLGYAFSLFGRDTSGGINNEKGLVYNGGFWTITRDDGSVLTFSSSLEDTKDIPVDINVFLEDYYQKPVFIVTNDSLVSLELQRVIGVTAGRIQRACYGPCDEELPEKSCNEDLIIFRDSEMRKVYQQDKCIFIEGDIKAVDAFLYKLAGIN